MKIEFSTKFNVGDKLYYLRDMEIKETYIKGIRLNLRYGDMGCFSEQPELVYYIDNSDRPCIGDGAVLQRYFLSKGDIIKALAEQI